MKRLILTLMVILLCAALMPAQAQDGAVHIVTASHPNATFSRAGWAEFTALVAGQQLTPNDIIDPADAPVRVLCANLTEVAVTTLGPPPCPEERAVLEQDEEPVAAWQRAPIEDLLSPFLISPRDTTVLPAQVHIRWNPTPDATDGYRVTVRGGDVNWSTEIDDPDISAFDYPDDAPPLEPGQSYTVEVVALDFGAEVSSSADEDAPDATFRVMDPKDAADVETTATAISSSATESSDVVMAHFYMQRDLNADALAMLEAQTGDLLLEACPSDEAASPMPYRMLGDLYKEIGVEIYAQAAYACARDLAAASGDMETEARALTGLAMLATLDAQEEYLDAALALWETLGAQDKIDELKAVFNLEDDAD